MKKHICLRIKICLKIFKWYHLLSLTLYIAACLRRWKKYKHNILELWVILWLVFSIILLLIQFANQRYLPNAQWGGVVEGVWTLTVGGNLSYLFLFVLPIFRINEIVIAFLKDTLSKLPSSTCTKAKPKKINQLGLKERMVFAIFSLCELIINFGILYSILPGTAWKDRCFFDPITPFDSIYYSVVTITTLGYGDIVPISSFSRFLSMYEVIAGILMLVLSLAVYMTWAQGIPQECKKSEKS